jgi:hypothetical protein
MSPLRRKILLGLAVLVLLVAAFAVTEHLRGRWALQRELADLRARGESVDVTELTPLMPPTDQDGGSVFLGAAGQLAGKSQVVSDVPGAWKPIAPGKVRLATRERAWPRMISGTKTNLLTAEELAAGVESARAELEALRGALKKPALYFGTQYSLKANFAHLATGKRTVSWLRAASLDCLLRSDVEGSRANLEAMASLATKQADERLLISQLVALAEANVGVGATWEALQSQGWSEAQLARLQSAWGAGSNYVAQMGWAMEMERAMSRDYFERATPSELMTMLDFSGSFWNPPSAPTGPAWTSFDQILDELPKRLARAFQRGVYLPLWSFLWADQDEARLLRQWRDSIEAARQAAASHSLLAVKGMIPERDGDWFWSGEEDGKAKPSLYDRCRYLVSSRVGGSEWRANSKAATGEAVRTLAVTAIALQRYQLRHGKPAPDLAALVPDILPAVPLDPMDGKPLRYRLKSDGTFLLYSVGEDGVDNGGDGSRRDGSSSSQPSFFQARDLVWPVPATPEEVAEADKKLEGKKGRQR